MVTGTMTKIAGVGLIVLGLAGSCGPSRYQRMFEELKNMPAADYSYVVEPSFPVSKEASEENLKEFYAGDEFRIGGAGTHGYDGEQRTQINERYWLKAVVVNTSRARDLTDEAKSQDDGKEIAKAVVREVENIASYNKIEVMFLQQWNDGQPKSIKRRVFFTLPELKITDWNS